MESPDVPYYKQHPTGIECRFIVEHFPYHIGTCIAYLWRCKFKHETPIQDLYKARDHLTFEM